MLLVVALVGGTIEYFGTQLIGKTAIRYYCPERSPLHVA
jgi:hypothetical protein